MCYSITLLALESIYCRIFYCRVACVDAVSASSSWCCNALECFMDALHHLSSPVSREYFPGGPDATRHESGRQYQRGARARVPHAQHVSRLQGPPDLGLRLLLRQRRDGLTAARTTSTHITNVRTTCGYSHVSLSLLG